MQIPTKRLIHKENKDTIIVNLEDIPEFLKKGYSEDKPEKPEKVEKEEVKPKPTLSRTPKKVSK